MTRRSPEAYLSQAEDEEKKSMQGKLKIYLGAAPGVGKTYQMLSDALVKRSQGIDVVIGVVETHGRQEVESLASAFEKTPCTIIKKNNIKLKSLNLENIFMRAPGLVLIDEAAYSNPEGSIHPKRWQDILAIIAKGIDVYTTLNIQHLESLNDLVGRLIGIPVYETVPDDFIEQATVIELIDLPSEELINRLKEGKVYLPADASVAINHFFKKSNLDALRELALRIAAERVNAAVKLYKEDALLACVNGNIDMGRLLRTAKRISSRLNCNWHALFIDSGDQNSFSAAQHWLNFARSLGATTHVIFATNILFAIEDYIIQNKINHVVIGKRKAGGWNTFRLFKHLTNKIKDIGIYLIDLPTAKFNLRQYFNKKVLISMVFLLVSAAVMAKVKNIFSPWDFGWLTSLFVLVIAYLGAWQWVFFLLSLFIGLDLLFNERSFEYFLSHTGLWLQQYGSWSLLLLSLSAYLIYAKKKLLLAREIERYNSQILAFYQCIAHARGRDAVFVKTTDFLKKYFHLKVRFFLHNANTLQQVYPKHDSALPEKEYGIVQWVFESGEEAGMGTGNLIFSHAYYLPWLSAEGTIGVVRFDGGKDGILDAHKKILGMLMQQVANNMRTELDKLI